MKNIHANKCETSKLLTIEIRQPSNKLIKVLILTSSYIDLRSLGLPYIQIYFFCKSASLGKYS